MEAIEKFYVVTESGSIYEVKYDNIKISTSVKNIFSFNPRMARIEVGHELYPEGRFVVISKDCGLCKYKTEDNPKIDINKSKRFVSMKKDKDINCTSPIMGLFHKKKDAFIFYIYKHAETNENWFEHKSSQDVLRSIGFNHPVINFSMELIK